MDYLLELLQKNFLCVIYYIVWQVEQCAIAIWNMAVAKKAGGVLSSLVNAKCKTFFGIYQYIIPRYECYKESLRCCGRLISLAAFVLRSSSRPVYQKITT